MKYQIVLAGLIVDGEIAGLKALGHKVVSDGIYEIAHRTEESFTFQEAQNIRDQLIKRGCAPSKVRVEYHRKPVGLAS